MPLSSGAEVLVPRLDGTGAADIMIEAEKRTGEIFCRHAGWPRVADAVIEADMALFKPEATLILLMLYGCP